MEVMELKDKFDKAFARENGKHSCLEVKEIFFDCLSDIALTRRTKNISLLQFIAEELVVVEKEMARFECVSALRHYFGIKHLALLSLSELVFREIDEERLG